MPMVAANEKGIVGVAWHDRRESADRRGWVLRFAVSFDGGESFTPSERISEGAMNADDNAKFRMLASHRPATGIDPHHVALIGGKWITGGHTNGISVDARGAFHLLWSDNRTGVDQLWTAAVIVRGEGVLHGDPTLTALDDISKDLGIEATNTTYDSVEHTVVTHIRLINLSSAPICGPLKVRATGVRSEIGTPTLLNAQNREPGAGAIWTVYPQLPEKCLVPKASSSEFIISAHLVDLQPMSESADREFLSLDLRIFGPARRGGS